MDNIVVKWFAQQRGSGMMCAVLQAVWLSQIMENYNKSTHVFAESVFFSYKIFYLIFLTTSCHQTWDTVGQEEDLQPRSLDANHSLPLFVSQTPTSSVTSS